MRASGESSYFEALGGSASAALPVLRAAAAPTRSAPVPELLQVLDELRAELAPLVEPQQLLCKLSLVAARALPHEQAGLVLLPDGGAPRCSSASGSVALPPSPALLGAALARPPGSGQRSAELVSSPALGSGVRAKLSVAGRVPGELSFFSHTHAYTPQDLLFSQLLAHELGGALTRAEAALAHGAWAELDVWDQLLRALAGALDLQEVFPQVSAIAARVLPHDRLTMSFHDGAGSCVLKAVSNHVGPSAFRVTKPAPPLDGSFKLIDDLALDKPDALYDPPDARQQIVHAGYRALLSVCLSARDQQLGLQFWSRHVAGFTRGQLPLARRIAEHVALAVSHQQLAETASRAAEAQARAERLQARVLSLSEELDSRAGYAGAVGQSDAWKSVLKAATQVAATDTTVLLTGESGTGKEVIARFIHRASPKSAGPFVAVNCAALPEQLLESELFGHERGAFTGAQQSKPGRIELATGGVLFLDEVGEMSSSAQAKLLRVLQEREFQRLGGTRTIKANVRVIAATNRELRRALARGDFREDLYYRLQVFEIRLPPLRSRALDILPLSEAFLAEIGRSFGRPPAGMTREARKALLDYSWPGNARELRNVLERAAIVCEGGLIAPEHLALSSSPGLAAADGFGGVFNAVQPGSTNVKAVERQLIERVLEECQGNKSQAARRLGLTRKQLYVRLRQYDGESV